MWKLYKWNCSTELPSVHIVLWNVTVFVVGVRNGCTHHVKGRPCNKLINVVRALDVCWTHCSILPKCSGTVSKISKQTDFWVLGTHKFWYIYRSEHFIFSTKIYYHSFSVKHQLFRSKQHHWTPKKNWMKNSFDDWNMRLPLCPSSRK